jgi:hypothetical protein
MVIWVGASTTARQLEQAFRAWLVASRGGHGFIHELDTAELG